MKKRSRQERKDFDREFDAGKISIDFSSGVVTEGLSQIVKLSPLNIPRWLAMEIENIARHQADSKASVVRQLLIEAVKAKRRAA